jgi:hypothetical protein
MAFWKEYLDVTNGKFQLQRLENFQNKMLFMMAHGKYQEDAGIFLE